MSFAISIIGCIFGCRISNAPNYELSNVTSFLHWRAGKERVPIVENVPNP